MQSHCNAEEDLRAPSRLCRHTDLSKCVCMPVCSPRQSMPAKTQAPLWWWPLHTPWTSWQVSTAVPPLFYLSHVSTMWPGSWHWANQRPPSPPPGSRTAPPLPPELNPLQGFNAGVLSSTLSPMQWSSPLLPSGHLWQNSPFPTGPVETVGEVCACRSRKHAAQCKDGEGQEGRKSCLKNGPWDKSKSNSLQCKNLLEGLKCFFYTDRQKV